MSPGICFEERTRCAAPLTVITTSPNSRRRSVRASRFDAVDHGADRANQTMKRTRQNPTMPGTVIDHRGITLSAGVAAFDEALVNDTAKDPTDTAQSQSDGCGRCVVEIVIDDVHVRPFHPVSRTT
jgi:hypothetical protein